MHHHIVGRPLLAPVRQEYVLPQRQDVCKQFGFRFEILKLQLGLRNALRPWCLFIEERDEETDLKHIVELTGESQLEKHKEEWKVT